MVALPRKYCAGFASVATKASGDDQNGCKRMQQVVHSNNNGEERYGKPKVRPPWMSDGYIVPVCIKYTLLHIVSSAVFLSTYR